jgi:hypothetical protein
MQTNIKLVELGKDLTLQVKKIKLEGEPLTPKQIQNACTKLKVAGTPYYDNQRNQFILIESKATLAKNEIAIDEWVIKLVPTDEEITLSYINKEDRKAIAEIYKRSLLQSINATKQFWTLDSPRIFYENNPFYQDNEVRAFRRFEVSEIDMGENGLGFAVDISTAFFSNNSIFDYFKMGREKEFYKILGRQKEQKGTLLYAGCNSNSKCYFERFDRNLTLGTAPSVCVLGETFTSPFDYYKKMQPKFSVSEHDKTVLVSFPTLESKVYVPANKVFLRLMNDVLSNHIGKMDKINPTDRKNYLERNFWSKLNGYPFGKNLVGIDKSFYEPKSNECGIISLPNILFKGNKKLFAPQEQSKEEYKKHYKNRRDFLERNKCFDVFGGNDGSKLFFIVPENIDENVIDAYEIAIVAKIELLTGQSVEPIRITYDHYMSGIYELKNNNEEGFVIFLFQEEDSEPMVYYNIERELSEEWNLKRATVKELDKKYRKWQLRNLDPNDRDWCSYIEMTTLSIIQRMNCTPYVVDPSRFNYDMHLTIDVSKGGSHFAFSLQIWNKEMSKPIFSCHAMRKPGDKKESINQLILEVELYKFLSEKAKDLKRYKIEKLLILRDGKFCDTEHIAVEKAFTKLNNNDLLPNKFTLDFVEYHKTTRKEIRFWKNDANVLEGSYFFINPMTIALATTGAGTLNQGTSDPIVLISKFSSSPNMKNIVEDIFLSSQFNFSNPKVAQRLTLAVAKADSLLQEKREQEIQRIK